MYALSFAVATLASMSCNGVVGSVGAGDSGTGGKVADGPETNLACTAVSPGPSFIRRLNRFEYNNTVRDLLGTSARPGDGFPAEERRNGFDNDAASLQVSPALAEQYMSSAEKLSAYVVSRLGELLPCDPARDGEDACGDAFISAFGSKAYRQPLTEAHTARLRKVFDAGRKLTGFQTGIKLVVQTVLQSPEFLYRVELGAPPEGSAPVVKLTSFEMASRLSYLLWQSMPDDTLRAEAAQDRLTSTEAVAAQVTRMLADPRAHEVVAHFHDLWLHLDEYATIEKDSQTFPTFSPELVPLMTEETHRFIDHVIWEGAGNVGALFTSPFSFMNAKLATYYGVQGPPGEAFARVELDPSQRMGLLTQGGLLSMLGKANQTAPIQRGKFVREQLLCTTLPPPPPGITIKVPEVSASLSTRERFAAHRSESTCSGCHSLMDPIGLALENYDGAGQFRTTENGAAIDASGDLIGSDVAGVFEGATGLARKLGESDDVKRCVATEWFRYAYGRSETDEDACTLATVNRQFKASSYKVTDLIVALTQTDAFMFRHYVTPGGAQ